MKKLLATYYIDKPLENDGYLKRFSIVEDIITSSKTIMAKVHCSDGVYRTIEYPIAGFENQAKINIGELMKK